MATTPIIQLKFDQKYRSATAKIKLPDPPKHFKQMIDQVVTYAEEAKMKTIVFESDDITWQQVIGLPYYHSSEFLKSMRPLKNSI